MLDDDPTGSQEAAGVPVMLGPNRDELVRLLESNTAVYLITNTRSVTEQSSRELLLRLRADIEHARQELHVDILVVQRGDSTLRGHVFSEIEVFADPGSLIVFAPAFPAGGRETVDGVHRVFVGDTWLNAADTEFADDPVFGFTARTLPDYVRERSDRTVVTSSPGDFLTNARSARPGSVLVPDARSNSDLELLAQGILSLVDEGAPLVVRCAAPLAAYLARVKSTALIDLHTIVRAGPVLVVAGSHTSATNSQLAALLAEWPALVEIDTHAAIAEPGAASVAAAGALRDALTSNEVVVLSTERVRRAEHASLEDASRVMAALSSTVALVADLPGLVIAKGGITSADIAHVGLGAGTAWVDGQVAAGISLWRIDRPGGTIAYIVVPGNIGEPDTLLELVRELVDQ